MAHRKPFSLKDAGLMSKGLNSQRHPLSKVIKPVSIWQSPTSEGSAPRRSSVQRAGRTVVSTPTTGTFSVLADCFAESCAKISTSGSEADSAYSHPCSIKIGPAQYMPEGLFAQYPRPAPLETASVGIMSKPSASKFDISCVRSLRSNSKAASETATTPPPANPPPPVFRPHNSIIARSRLGNSLTTTTSPLPIPDLQDNPAFEPTSASPAKVTPMPRGMVVFQDNADGETVTPMGRTARMGLRTRPVLGNLTNTPGALRKTTLKKNLTTQMSEGVQVSHVVSPLTSRFALTAITPTAVSGPSSSSAAGDTLKDLSPVLPFKCTPPKTVPALTPVAGLEVPFAPIQMPHLPLSSRSAPSPVTPPAQSLPLPSPHLTAGLGAMITFNLPKLPSPIPVVPSSSSLVPQARSVLGPTAPASPEPSPLATLNPSASSVALCDSLPGEAEVETQQDDVSSPSAKQHWFPMTGFLILHFLAYMAIDIIIPALAAVATALVSLLPELVAPTLLLLDVFVVGSTVQLFKLSTTVLIPPIWRTFKSWAPSASTGSHPATPANHTHLCTPANLTSAVLPPSATASSFFAPPNPSLRPSAATSTPFTHVGPPHSSVHPAFTRPIAPYRLTRPGLPLTSLIPSTTPIVDAVEASPNQTTPYDIHPTTEDLPFSPMDTSPIDWSSPSAPWNVDVPASPLIPRCIFPLLQEDGITGDFSTPAVSTSWSLRAANLLACISIWVFYNVVVRALAGIAKGSLHFLLLTLVTMYWIAKKIVVCYLPRGTGFVITRLIRTFWAITKGTAMVAGFTLIGSSCAVVGTHKLCDKTEQNKLLQQQVTDGAAAAEELLRTIRICHTMGVALPQDPISLPPSTTHVSSSQALLHMEIDARTRKAKTSCSLDFVFAISLVVCQAVLNQPAKVICKAVLSKPSTVNEARIRWLMANNHIAQIRGH